MVVKAVRKYLWPDRPNDDYPNAKHVWKYFAVGFLVYFVFLYVLRQYR